MKCCFWPPFFKILKKKQHFFSSQIRVFRAVVLACEHVKHYLHLCLLLDTVVIIIKTVSDILNQGNQGNILYPPTALSAGGLIEGGIAGNFTKTLAYTWNTPLIAVIKVELCNEHSRFLENWTERSQNKVNGKSNYSFQQCPVWSKSPTVPPH